MVKEKQICTAKDVCNQHSHLEIQAGIQPPSLYSSQSLDGPLKPGHVEKQSPKS
jgi:hypothetical protein